MRRCVLDAGNVCLRDAIYYRLVWVICAIFIHGLSGPTIARNRCPMQMEWLFTMLS